MNDEMPEKYAPPGFRFLYQAIGCKTAPEAHVEAIRIFGKDKCNGMVIKRGCCRPESPSRLYVGWRFQPNDGYMIFIPR